VGADSGAGGGSYIASELFNVLASAGYNGNGLQSAADGYVIVGFQVFNYTGTVVQFTIPQTGNWWVAAVGAQGGNTGELFTGNGGYGAAVGGDIFLTEGTLLDILAGGAGIDAGGGGGSFVWDPAPLPRQPVPIPEPSTWTMMLLGLAGLGFAGYRRARVGAQHRRGSRSRLHAKRRRPSVTIAKGVLAAGMATGAPHTSPAVGVRILCLAHVTNTTGLRATTPRREKRTGQVTPPLSSKQRSPHCWDRDAETLN
jgi:hypothetical protein